MTRGLFIVQLPPPVHGVTVMNEHIVADSALKARIGVEVLRLAYASELAQLNQATLAKLRHWVNLLARLLLRLAVQRPDFVYFTPVPTGRGYLRDLPFMLLTKCFGVPLVLHLHGKGIAEQAEKPVARALYRLGFSGCALISASEGMRAHELETLGLRAARLYVVPNTVRRVDPCSPARGNGCNGPRLLYLSSTFPFKGIFVLLESMRLLQRRGVAVHLDIVGASTLENQRRIDAFLDAHELRSRVRVMGALFDEAKQAALANADVLVHPTLNDYFPLVVLEAMQRGIAIVATRVGAIPEMVVDSVHGLLVAPDDALAFADAIETLVAAPDRIRAMGAASKCRFEALYSPEEFSRRLLGVLEAERLLEGAS